jgi:HD superfamily phosphohydrolase
MPVPTPSPQNSPSPDQPIDMASPFCASVAETRAREAARQEYLRFTGKDPLRAVFMRSALSPDRGIQLDPQKPLEGVILGLWDEPALQRLKYVSQLSAASWVYPDALLPRFGHVLGSACLTAEFLEYIRSQSPPEVARQIDEWGPISVVFAMTHDIGHIAPGSHVAQRVWFPRQNDEHEAMSHSIIKSEPGFRSAVERVLGVSSARKLDLVIAEDPSVPKWTWQIITAGVLNLDRLDWVRRDGLFCGVSYGSVDIPILKKNVSITNQGEFVIREEGVSVVERFFTARADLYRNVYRHRTCRIGEKMLELVAGRARELLKVDALEFADSTVRQFLLAEDGLSLSTSQIMSMVEYRWLYHLDEWTRSEDLTLRELSKRVLIRQPFKHYPADEYHRRALPLALSRLGLDERYFFVEMEGAAVNLKKDISSAIKVLRRNGEVQDLLACSPYLRSLSNLETLKVDPFLAAPENVCEFISMK